ncbi:hypothetical protein WDB89_16140 [Pseudoalteromonas sp. B5MOD-1]|uniref:hypothetical protein n=1 Tax=Pseudoalteromonas sp. P80D2 TaxID=3113903 RepID=UPI002FC79CFB
MNREKNKITIHIGFHKTATTSYQKSIFPNLENVEFLGRNWKGVSESASLYQEICEYCFNSNSDERNYERINAKLADLLETKSILISDEWFLSDYSGFYGVKSCPWQMKLRKLAKLLSNFEHEVIVFIRSPLDCLFSQYCEFKTVGLPDALKSFNRYLNSNDAKAYDYCELERYLNTIFQSVNFVTFETLISYPVSKLYLEKEVLNVKILKSELEHTNNKVVNNNKVQVKVVKKGFFAKFYDSYISHNLRRKLKKIKFLGDIKNYLYSNKSSIVTVPLDEKKIPVEMERMFSNAEAFYQGKLDYERKFEI